ncbi:MAG TPA: hypothetical protein VF194_16030 [Ferrovibrio sp.]|uniref:hypothetical protein n=1 Tax=Ferrovibrio sp. TaxID=1917215 RepID=UPI002ED254BE
MARPDLLLSGDGKVSAARAADGRYYYQSGSVPPRSFVGKSWWERLGAPPLYPWPKLRRNDTEGRTGADGSLRCDPAGCAWRHDGFLVAMPQQPHAITEDCHVADVVIDRFDLWRSGARALWLDREKGIRVLTVAETRGHRPWVLPRGHGVQEHRSAGPQGREKERQGASPRPASDP